MKNPIFQRVEHLSLSLDGGYPYASLRLLQTIVDLSTLANLSIQVLLREMSQRTTVTNYISSILKETQNIHSLKFIYVHIGEPFINVETICSIIPRSVKHLQLSITTLDDMKYIVEQLNQLFSVTFYSANLSDCYEDIVKWVALKRKNSIYGESRRSLQIWLGVPMNNDNEKSSVKKVFQRLYSRQSSR